MGKHTSSQVTSSFLTPNHQSSSLRQRIRKIKDKMAQYAVAVGGISVIITIVLIFFYLLFIVLPIFSPAETKLVSSYSLFDRQDKTEEKSLYLAMEEQAEIAVQLSDKGRITFFNTRNGDIIKQETLALTNNTRISSHAQSEPNTAINILGLSNGYAYVIKQNYRTSFENDTRHITPEIKYPMGQDSIQVDATGHKLEQLAIQDGEDALVIAATTDDQRLLLVTFTKESSFMEDETSFERSSVELPYPKNEVSFLLLNKDQQLLYVASKNGTLTSYDTSDLSEPVFQETIQVTNNSEQLTTLSFLAGDISLLIGTSNGQVSQWFPVKDKSGKELLKKIRTFGDYNANSPITSVAPEYYRKGFVVTDASGTVGIYHATAHRTLLETTITDHEIKQLAVSPHADAMLVEDSKGLFHFISIENEHPEISWAVLWGKVWYESYPEPDYIWQSSSASNDFEPKLSLVPITFGTIKAAFYAMLFAIPLAIAGAIFTAQFMAPKMRSVVKPSIETIEALPTVILGFLAGLWLAPILETYLPGILTMLIMLPTGIIAFTFAWGKLPKNIQQRVPEGWEAALLIPVVLFIGAASIYMSPIIEGWWFGGDMRHWLTNEMGISYDQRNSLVVGLAMGFAVIPTIFSITEDAIFAVPKHLVNGSLALGATQWQTLIMVVLLTASPGIFSAVMIGFGRAVGETMIVLMATGNTPVMDFSIFQGMRTLSANIAVEMPEAEVASTHYRVLFLAALVLFIFTFIFNTVAEIVRQRLRAKYSTL